MTLMTLVKQAEKFTADHSPLILTAIGVTGTVTTAVLTGKATFKAAEILNEMNPDHIAVYPDLPGEYTTKEKVKLVWKLYTPAVSVGILTATSIILANRIGTRRAAAMAAAYGLSEKAFSQYKDQVIEHFGTAKEQKVRDDLSQKQVHDNPPSDNSIVITNAGDVLCYEPYTGRYFQSDIETLKKAQNDLNYQVLNNFYASLSEFYNLIGLETTLLSDDVGWNSDKMLELTFSGTLTPDNRPCMVMNYQVTPIKNYSRVQ